MGDDMRRKLVNYEVFQKINENSITKSEKELVLAEEVLAKALGEIQLNLHCFDESSVTYETLDKSYIHAGYRLDGSHIIFENIEQLIIDESSARETAHNSLRKMFDSVLEKNEAAADEAFKEYISYPFVRRGFMEQGIVQTWAEPKSKLTKGKKQSADTIMKRVMGKKRSQANKSPFDKEKAKEKRDQIKKVTGAKYVHLRFKPQGKRKMKEWYSLVENVFNYLDYQEFGPVANQSEIKKDEKGNVVAIRIPDSKSRNEGKILSFNWKTLTADNTVLRAKMKNLAEDNNFCKAMRDLKQCNALSDNDKLQNVLEAVVARWPNIIYLTQTELAEAISTALETIGATNYDDRMCVFMAEGILRTAADAYPEKVEKIVKMSGIKVEATDDKYVDFQNVVHKFYTFLDENLQLEMQVFVDLYNALVEVHKLANEEGNSAIVNDVHSYLKELKAVIEHESEPTLDLAGEVAAWLSNLVETNLEGGDWDVSNTPYMTVNGSHPQMAKDAAKPYAPSADFSGDWGDPAPVSDGKNYKGGLADEMRGDAWGNWANDDTWPGLQNPYVKGATAAWLMKGPDSAATTGDSDWSRYQSGDTWPALQNPYVPKEAGGVGGSGYKAKTDNLVVDK
jgi:hypothetical protein